MTSRCRRSHPVTLVGNEPIDLWAEPCGAGEDASTLGPGNPWGGDRTGSAGGGECAPQPIPTIARIGIHRRVEDLGGDCVDATSLSRRACGDAPVKVARDSEQQLPHVRDDITL
jgi:hypothetical protein